MYVIICSAASGASARDGQLEIPVSVNRAEYLHSVLARDPPERIPGQSAGNSQVNGGASQERETPHEKGGPR